MMKVRVSVKRWLRGGRTNSALRNTQGKMCCLGFACHQMGAKTAAMVNIDMPAQIPNGWATLGPLTTDGGRNSELAWKAAAINDDDAISDHVRKQRLRALFKDNGHQIVFVP